MTGWPGRYRSDEIRVAGLETGPISARALTSTRFTSLRALVERPDHPFCAAGLTPREVEALRLIAAGRTNKEIATELIISVATVERHIFHIYAKIGARGRADAIAYALRHGLV